LNETISRIKEGVRNVEVSLVSPEIAEGIPKQQFQEMYALMKLTGVKPSVHAPVIDPSGFSGQQQIYNESERADTERRFMDVLEKAHELDPKGNIPVVFHASNAGTGASYRPEGEEGTKDRFHIFEDTIVNRETGQLQRVKEDRRFYHDHESKGLLDPNKPLDKQGKIYDTQYLIEISNKTEWDNKLREIFMLKKEAEENIDLAVNKGKLYEMQKEIPISEKDYETTKTYWDRARVFMEDAEMAFREVFNRTYEYGTKEQKEKLVKLANKWNKEEKTLTKDVREETGQGIIQSHLLDKRIFELNEALFKKEKNGQKYIDYGETPKIFTRAQDFVVEKASKTFGNVAWQAYDKWKDESPIIAIENLYPGMSFSRAEDLKELIEKTKANFIEKAKSKGMSESEAKSKADKLIGATWDVGHLNIHKKHGFTDKDLTEETKKIAKLVKHVHLTDNFGFGDSHLAMGMGNVPIKEHLKILEKEGKFNEMRKVIEAGGLVNPNMGLKMNPFRATLGAFGSPIVDGGNPIYWNQAENIQGNYFGFPMAYMPEKHFSMYGSGFSTLPEELGGQIPGSQSRFSGTPNS